MKIKDRFILPAMSRIEWSRVEGFILSKVEGPFAKKRWAGRHL